MADIFKFPERKPELKSPAEVAEKSMKYISEGWEKHAVSNRLNQFIVENLGYFGDDSVSYLTDLNLISSIENKLGLVLIMSATRGWVAATHISDEVFLASPPMAYETYARCFNVILFLKYHREIKLLASTT